MQQQQLQFHQNEQIDKMITTTTSSPTSVKTTSMYNNLDISSIPTPISPTTTTPSQLSMPSGVVIMQQTTATTTTSSSSSSVKDEIPNDKLNFYRENVNENNKNDENKLLLLSNTSENAKDLLLKLNLSQINNLNESHCININNNNLINKSAFNCKTNSDKNINNINKFHNNNNNNLKKLNRCINIQQNGWNTNLNIITTTINDDDDDNDNDNDDIIENNNDDKNNDLKLSSIIMIDHENAYNQRSYIEDVHNYSKKSIKYELFTSTTTDNNTSTDDDDIDNDNDDDDHDIDYDSDNNFNLSKKNYKIKKFIVETENNNNNNNKWLKNVKNLNINKKEKLQANKKCNNNKMKIQNDNYDKLTPDHHARRPMNAFLIFCKRHRGIVREKYKNVENRQITKILGEWWANMTKEEKSCYANLAKENKDAFLSANPNFKWYKLPAPPLRTLSTRPMNGNSSCTSENSPTKIINEIYNDDENIILPNNNIITPNFKQHHKRSSPTMIPTSTVATTAAASTSTSTFKYDIDISSLKSQTDVGVFKFADIAQMGSLNSLICGNSPTTDSSKSSSSLSPTIQSNELQNALGETSNFLSTAITNKNYQNDMHEPFENMRDHATKMNNNQKLTISRNGVKRKLNCIEIENNENNTNNKNFIRDSSFSSSEDDGSLINRKLSRSCKGKKYQELINSGQISVLTKKQKKSQQQQHQLQQHQYLSPKMNNNHNEIQIVNNNLKDSSSDSDYFNQIQHKTDNSKIIKLSPIETATTPTTINMNNNNNKKQLDLIDFDLDSKIMALPAQCLEQYLLKKQESKSKKKINSKRRKTTTQNINNNNKIINNKLKSPIKTIHDMKEQIVGSQKRKARKESITRRDVNIIQNDTKLMNFVEFNVGDNYDNDDCNNKEIIQNVTPLKNSDLLILAQVASNFDEKIML